MSNNEDSRIGASRGTEAPGIGLRLGHLLEAAPDAILEVDQRGRILLVNAATEKLFGYRRDELIGMQVEQLVPPEVRGRHGHHRENYSAHPLSRPMGSGLQLEGQRKDGTKVPVEISLSPFESEEGFRVGAIIRDVSERVRAEAKLRALQAEYTAELTGANRQLEARRREAEAANQLKSEFLASMSHELRTPLHTIIGFAELLTEGVEGNLTDKQHRFVNHILNDGRHLLALINDILDLSKIEAGRLQLERENFIWTEALAEVLATIQPQAVTKGVAVSSVGLPTPVVNADRLRLKEILYNLLSNAVKFTPSGGQVWIEATFAQGLLTVSVRDTGIGIAADQLEKIFDKFHQASPTTKGVREGTGLGLSIARQLVELHGGRLVATSSPGHGSTFTFTLPERSLQDQREVGSKPEESSAPLVLIIDSDRAARELLVSYLEPQGYRTEVAGSRREALECARQLRPDAITLDVLAPESEGWAVLGELRRMPETAQTPVLVVSVMDQGQDVATGGATAYISKPVDPSTLLSTLREHIRTEPGTAPRILVVDDEAGPRHLLQDVLGKAGYLPILNSSGREALETLTKTEVSAVIVDLMMPEMSGFEFLFRVKETPSLRDLPLLVLTAKELSSEDIEVLRQDTKAVFLKGANWREDLVSHLRHLLPASRPIAAR